jgi:hypothetical protein
MFDVFDRQGQTEVEEQDAAGNHSPPKAQQVSEGVLARVCCRQEDEKGWREWKQLAQASAIQRCC